MSFNDDFFEELLALGGTIREIRSAMIENLPEVTLLALESANATLSTRALQILDGIISDAIIARAPIGAGTAPPERDTRNTPVSSPSSTVPENTSSQPSPGDLAVTENNSTSGILTP